MVGAHVVEVRLDKNGNRMGFCKPQQGVGSEGELPPKIFFFESNVDCAGLDLAVGDKLARVKVKSKEDSKKENSKNKPDVKVASAVLHVPMRDLASRFPRYLAGLNASLGDRSRRESAVASLCQRGACAAVWDQIGKNSLVGDGFLPLVEEVIGVLEELVSLVRSGGVSSGGAAKDALGNILASGISLPGSMLEKLVTASVEGGGVVRASLRKRLVEVNHKP